MSNNPKNLIYDNKGKDRDFNIYTEEFLGGADTFIYINGERCKDISAVQYSVREQKQPIYGYASRRYDDVASGIRIVKGLLKIPIRNTSKSDTISKTTTRNANLNAELPPSWVYNYAPEKESNSLLPENNNSSFIYDIQSELKSSGYNVDVTGVMDNKTKIAIIKSRRSNKDFLTCECDNKTATHCSISKDSNCYISPNENSLKLFDVKKSSEGLILNEVKGFYLISFDGKEGYIKKGDVLI